MKPYFKTKLGQIIRGDSLDYMASLESESIDLIVTSPPFGLVRKKAYGNVESHKYVDWFIQFGREFKRLLKPSGSQVIGIGGAWILGCRQEVCA
jgi:site-specific DNA-methyltransferase (cytosine-N4-specific)